MKTAKVCLLNPENGRVEQVIALLDTGATHSYITSEKANKLQLRAGPARVVKMNTFGKSNASDVDTWNTCFQVKQANGSKKKISARICKGITGSFTKVKIPLEKYDNVWKNLKMADDLPTEERNIKVDFLIGNDFYEDFMRGDKIEIDKGLYLVSSSLGWMFSGRIPNVSSNDETEQSMIVLNTVDVAHAFWSLEGVGIQAKEVSDSDDLEALNYFNKTVKNVDGRTQVRWPYKTSKYELPSNYSLCQARLKSLLAKSDDETKAKYDEVIKNQHESGIIQVADSSEKYVQQDHVVRHYIPHHIVDNGVKSRMVFEGNAKTHPSTKSLNQCLSPGPNLLPDLVGILIRFRLNPVAFMADIEKAYLQMQLHPDDRDVTRFLWVKDITEPPTESNIQEFRFCRVIWGIISAAFLLACTITYHLTKKNSEVCKDVMKNTYVDNLASGSNNTETAIRYYHETKAVFNEISMNMCKWSSNSKELMENFSPSDRCEDKVVKLLGMIWNLEADSISLMKHEEEVEVITKRSIMKLLGCYFIPMGLYSPALLPAKLFLQELWCLNLTWDEILSEEMQRRWRSIFADLKDLHTICVKRCITTFTIFPKRRQLIVFCDASQWAYATTVYMKSSSDDKTDVNLIFSKSRLAPINTKLSIPRLELMGVLIGCRSAKFVANHVGVSCSDVEIFTDSKCVVEWCKSEKDLKGFVSRRVEEIKGHGFQVNYVKGEDNPADIASRGISAIGLKENKMWWKGPDWLRFSASQWPKNTYVLEDDTHSAVKNEEKGSKVLYEASLIVGGSLSPAPVMDINAHRFSSHVRLIRVTAWCLRFLHNTQKNGIRSGVLTVQELKDATNLWTRSVQEECFPKTFYALKNDKPDHLKSKLGLYMDGKGLLRCQGRFSDQQRSPVLLPKDNQYTKLIVIRYHRKLLHSGVKQTLSATREDYWILKGRSVVRKIIRQCLICIHWEGGPFKTPPFAPLPKYVIDRDESPFTYVGLDYLGPLIVTKDRDLTKNWVCLFTCLKVRAIHLEVVQTMSAESFLLCLRRFISRRGTPNLIVSDNGSQIKLGCNVVKEIWNEAVTHEDIQSYVANEGVNWKFITEHAPWQGGFYERLVKMVKRALKKSLGKTKVDNEQLTTLITEIESVINSRPLLYVNDDVNSLETLTPAHFTMLNYHSGTPDIEEEYRPKETTVTVLLESWRKGQAHLNEFWMTWRKDYMHQLRESHTLQMRSRKGEIERFPVVGEAVLVKEENLSRGRWKIAKVSNLIKSELDDIPRAAKLTTSRGKILKRPLKDLYPLELFD